MPISVGGSKKEKPPKPTRSKTTSVEVSTKSTAEVKTDTKAASLSPPSEFMAEASLLKRELKDMLFATITANLMESGYSPMIVVGSSVESKFETQLTQLSERQDLLHAKVFDADNQSIMRSGVRRL